MDVGLKDYQLQKKLYKKDSQYVFLIFQVMVKVKVYIQLLD